MDIASLHRVALVYSILRAVNHLGVPNGAIPYSYATLPGAQMGNLHRRKRDKQHVGSARCLALQQVVIQVKII